MPELHRYDVHGLVRVHAPVRLPELESFRSSATRAPADIELRIVADPLRAGGLGSVVYREVPGRFGFAVAIDRRDAETVVHASPLLRRSPHVLYTNVVEPLLRWTLVRKGYALLHGACLAFGDRALFITARTDTGKTTTILRTIRADPEGCRFLSDDMTIVGRDGVARAFPKPLTISRHTVQAIGGAPLTLRERGFLAIQSRLHSKGGRGVGLRMADAGLPAATLSAVVQRLVPPPKFAVDRLIPDARFAERAPLGAVVVIERGPQASEPLPRDELVPTLIANAEDAYGFPPYPKIAHRISRWNGADLHEEERAIVAAATERLPAHRLASDAFDWHRHLPRIAVGGVADVRRGAPAPSTRGGEGDPGGLGAPRPLA